MADIVSRLPTQDQSDGATGSAIPTEAILVGGSDGTNLRALSTTSAGLLNIQSPDITVTGTISGSSSVTLTLNGQSSINIDVSGTWVGTIVINEPGTVTGHQLYVQLGSTSALASSITANGNYRVVGLPTNGTVLATFQSYTSGTATVTLRASTGIFFLQSYSLNAANLLTTAYTVDGSGNAINSQSNALNVNTKTNLVFSAPTTASVGTTSSLILAANSSRQGLYLSNTTSQQISLGFNGNAAVYQNGITLFPGEKFWMDEYSFSTGAVYAITTGAATYIGVQEIT
jgi:hypothetical protein